MYAPHRRLIPRFHDVIETEPDRIVPSLEDVERLLAFGREVCRLTCSFIAVPGCPALLRRPR